MSGSANSVEDAADANAAAEVMLSMTQTQTAPAATTVKEAKHKKKNKKKKTRATTPSRKSLPRQSKIPFTEGCYYELEAGGKKVPCLVNKIDRYDAHVTTMAIPGKTASHNLNRTVDTRQLQLEQRQVGDIIQCQLGKQYMDPKQYKEGKRYWWTARINKIVREPTSTSHGRYNVTPQDKEWTGGNLIVRGEKMRSGEWQKDEEPEEFAAVGPKGPAYYMQKAQKARQEEERNKKKKAKSPAPGSNDFTDLMEGPSPSPVLRFKVNKKGKVVGLSTTPTSTCATPTPTQPKKTPVAKNPETPTPTATATATATPTATATATPVTNTPATPEIIELLQTPVPPTSVRKDKYEQMAEQVAGILNNPKNPIRDELFRALSFMLTAKINPTPATPTTPASPASAAPPRKRKRKSLRKRLIVKKWGGKRKKARWGCYIPSRFQWQDATSSFKKYLYFPAHEGFAEKEEEWKAFTQQQISERTDHLSDAEFKQWIHHQDWNRYGIHPVMETIANLFISKDDDTDNKNITTQITTQDTGIVVPTL